MNSTGNFSQIQLLTKINEEIGHLKMCACVCVRARASKSNMSKCIALSESVKETETAERKG